MKGASRLNGRRTGGESPPRSKAAHLEHRVRLLAAASLIARAWPGEGDRHDAVLIVGGFLARAGVSETEAALMVEGILRAVGDPEWRDRLRAVRRSCASGRDRARLWTAEAEGAAREGRC